MTLSLLKSGLLALLLLPNLALSQTPIISVSATQTTICQGNTTQLSATVNLNTTPQITAVLNTSGNDLRPATCDCPSGYVVVGYKGRTGDVLDQLSLACKKLNPDGSLAPEVVYTSPAGGLSGEPAGPFIFPNNTAMVGINLRSTGNEFYKFTATGITGYGQPVSKILAANSNTTAPVALTTMSGIYTSQDAGTLYVPDGHVLTGITATSTKGYDFFVGSITLRYVPIGALLPPAPFTINWSSGQTGSSINVSPSQTTVYTARVTTASFTSPPTSFTITVNSLPTQFSVTGGGGYCPGGSGAVVGLAGSQTGVNYQLRRDGTNVGTAVAGTGSPLSFGNQTQVGTYTVLATNTTTTCQQPMTSSAVVTITPLPDAPGLVTASGYPYPAGQPALTLSQNVGPVILVGTGCSGGTLNLNGSNSTSLAVGTTQTGTQTYTATCTQNGCTGPAGSFSLTVVPTTLSVLHRDQDNGNTQNNVIKPFLELVSTGGPAIPYSELTVRYWFTSEGQAPPSSLTVSAPLGAVSMKYVRLSQPRQGALGYIEYSFPNGNSLTGGGNSGPIENGIQKTDGSTFNESDDYSYAANLTDYVPNGHITAYRNGTILWGQEPTVVASQTAVQIYSSAKDVPPASQIQNRVELRNVGNVALPVANLKLRYYFTSDNGQLASASVDNADIGAAKVQAKVVQVSSLLIETDSYVELSFADTTLTLNPLSSLGNIDFRLVRSDNGLLDQKNDYSFAANYGNVSLNNHITAYLNNTLVFGSPPSVILATVANEPVTELSVRVLGNPVMGSQAQVEIQGVKGQAVDLRLVDLQGKAIREQRIERAGQVEPVSIPLGSNRGILLLNVSTQNQQQQVKLLRP